MAKRSKAILKKIPVFRSEGEEARWYDAHREDLHKYVNMDDAEVVEPQPTDDRSGMTQMLSVRLPRRLLMGLRREAERREVSYQSLIKRWLAERLAQETTVSATRRSSRHCTKAA